MKIIQKNAILKSGSFLYIISWSSIKMYDLDHKKVVVVWTVDDGRDSRAQAFR